MNVTISELRQAIGEYVDKAKETPVAIVKHGKNVAFLVSPETLLVIETIQKLLKGEKECLP